MSHGMTVRCRSAPCALCAATVLSRNCCADFGRPPKGPFRTKNSTTIEKIVNYYAVVFLLRPPNLLRRGPFFERKTICNSQENGVRPRCAAIVNHPAVLKILHVVNLLRVVFLVRRGPLGIRKKVMSHLRDGLGVTAPFQKNIVPLAVPCGMPPL